MIRVEFTPALLPGLLNVRAVFPVIYNCAAVAVWPMLRALCR